MNLLSMTTPSPASSLPEPDGPRWQVLRAGLQNLWEYDDQRFVFHRGRLLLRGRNESGKTKALELLLPFLLDADLSPQRLDPFGSTSRPMRWNLVNEHNPEVQVSIGYAWLELGRTAGAESETCTLGAGLRAKRANPGVDVWYFMTAQRVDRDLHLLDRGRVPLTRHALQEAIGGAGRVFEGKNEYRQGVNRRLFELPDDQYAALMEALLQLRRPQLSKQLDPEQLSQILTASLPPLEARAVAPLAEGFERLDRHRAEREELSATLASLRSFTGVYRTYVATVAKARAQELTRADSAYQRARAELRRAQEEEQAAGARLADLVEAIGRLTREEEALGERIQALRSSEEYRQVEQLDRAEAEAASLALRGRKAAEGLGREQADLGVRQSRLAQAEEDLRAQVEKLGRRGQAAEAAAAEADLRDAHRAVGAQVEAADLEAARGTLESVLARRGEAIRSLSRLREKLAEAAAAERAAEERRREADGRVRDLEASLGAAEGAEAAAAGRFETDVVSWIDGLAVLSLDPGQRASVLDAPLEAKHDRMEGLVAEATARLDEEAAEVGTALREVAQRLAVTRAEHDALESATHRAPAPPAWRPVRAPERPGAPLYLLCDFRGGDARAQAAIEAALESSGLLDAWVLPDGAVLDPRTMDVLLRPGPRGGPTLADVLVATEAGEVGAEAVERVLRTVALAAEGETADGDAWVSADGRWRLGPLDGSWSKENPAFIGATARERERRRKLAELGALLRGLEEERDRQEGRLAGIRERREGLAGERRRFPSLDPVREARAQVAAIARQLEVERGVLRLAVEARARAESGRRAAGAARDAAASGLGLAAWVDRLDELREHGAQYRAAALELVAASRERMMRAEVRDERRAAAQGAAARMEEARIEAEDAGAEALRAEARAAALREAVGATRDELLAALREAEARRKAARGELEGSRRARSDADQQVGLARGAVESAGREVAQTEERRRGADGEVRQFARRGLLALVEVVGEGAPDDWTFTDTLLLARRVDAATGDLGSSEDAQEKAENRVAERQQELTRGLPSEVRLLPERAEGVLAYRAVWNGRSCDLPSLVAELAAEVEARDRLLGKEEADLFESFLSGEAHERLRARLREANLLVNRMNEQLAAHPTAAGMRLRLRWEVGEGAPPGVAEAIDLLLRAGHLLSDADRLALRQFLQQRLGDARTREGIGSLQERMLAVLDYRTWFSFDVEFQPAGEGWKRLTRKAHGAGSGGQKAVLLHLPLFAAAAAFYASAGPCAPRLIVLDEAFAGIDRETRGQLLGLLAEFGLDFVMTSYEEWGFYEELDGLSTYHLTRERGMRGVHTDWFLWDGRRAVAMDAPAPPM